MASASSNTPNGNRATAGVSISNKILLPVLTLLIFFTVSISLVSGLSIFNHLTDNTQSELSKMSGILSNRIIEIENKAGRFLKSMNENRRFMDQVRQISQMGPYYASDRSLLAKNIEDDENIYYFQAQMHLLNLLQPLLPLNEFSALHYYIISPFDLVAEASPVLSFSITPDRLYVMQFKDRVDVTDRVLRYIDADKFKPPPQEDIGISTVYSQSADTFYRSSGFNVLADAEHADFFISSRGSVALPSSKIVLDDGVPIIRTSYAIQAPMANPDTFADQGTAIGILVVDQRLDVSRIDQIQNLLGTYVGIGHDGDLLVTSLPVLNSDISIKDESTAMVGNLKYFYSSQTLLFPGTEAQSLEAMTFSPASKLNRLIETLFKEIIITGLVALLLAWALIYLTVQHLVHRPLKKMMDGVKFIAGGQLDYKVPVYARDELGRLASSFNEMSDALFRATAALNRERNYVQNIINSMPSVVVGVDLKGSITHWNMGAQELTGLKPDEAQGKSLTAIFPVLADGMEKVQTAIQTRTPQSDSKVLHVLDGQTRFSDITVYPLVANGVEGAVIRMDDVTDRVRIEDMMVQSEKMLSVGGLAAGTAHEINNPLAGILQNVQVLRNRLSGNIPKNIDTARECGIEFEALEQYMQKRGLAPMIDAVIESGTRAARIVDNMLSFSRRSGSELKWHSLPELLDKTVELASNDYDLKKKYDFRQIEIRRDYEKGLPQISCEGSQLQQVFLNILKNGAQAMAGQMPAGNPPLLTLRIRGNQGFIVVEIEDNGPGMDEATRKRAFEPFYTTKRVGVGTGLGLSVSYFIVTENHNGAMTVDSKPGKGARFTITLPIEPDET